MQDTHFGARRHTEGEAVQGGSERVLVVKRNVLEQNFAAVRPVPVAASSECQRHPGTCQGSSKLYVRPWKTAHSSQAV